MGQVSRSFQTESKPAPASYYHVLNSLLLQKRFTRAVFLSGIVSHLAACGLSISSTSSTWNPFQWMTESLGLLWPLRASIWKSLALWFGASFIMVARKATLRTKHDAYPSAFTSFVAELISMNTLLTLLSNLIVCNVLVLVYLRSAPTKADVGLLAIQRSNNIARLNERFLYLSFFAFHLSIVQTLYYTAAKRHLLVFPSQPSDIERQIRGAVNPRLRSAFFIAAVTCISCPLTYLAVQTRLWRTTHFVVKIFIKNSPHGWGLTSFDLLFKSVWIALIGCGWMALVGLLFEVYLSQAPVLNGKNISAQSATPNETLITGLILTGKPLPRAMAYQDLEYMAFNNPIQRKQLFLHTEPEPTVWQQIVRICLDTLTSSIKPFQVSETTPPQPLQSPQPFTNGQTFSPSPLSVKNDNIFLPSPSRKRITDRIKANSVTKTPLTSSVQSQAMVKPKVALTRIYDKAKSYVSYFLESPAGVPFRLTVALQGLNKLPEVDLPIRACRALTEICCASATNDEDPYGCISKELPIILETYCSAIQTLESAVKNPSIHWTDIDSRQNPESAKMENVNELVSCLRKSVKDINDVFGKFLSDTRLSRAVVDMCVLCSKYS